MENIEIEITEPKHILALGILFGLATAKTALEGDAPHLKVPGIGIAAALIDRELADQRSSVFQKNVLLAAKRGVDLTRYSVAFVHEGRKLVCKPLDLVEQAEG